MARGPAGGKRPLVQGELVVDFHYVVDTEVNDASFNVRRIEDRLSNKLATGKAPTGTVQFNPEESVGSGETLVHVPVTLYRVPELTLTQVLRINDMIRSLLSETTDYEFEDAYDSDDSSIRDIRFKAN